jgi:hypothetical protein
MLSDNYAQLTCSNSGSIFSSSDRVVILVVAAAFATISSDCHSCDLYYLIDLFILRFLHVRKYVHVLLETKTLPKVLPFIQTSTTELFQRIDPLAT